MGDEEKLTRAMVMGKFLWLTNEGANRVGEHAVQKSRRALLTSPYADRKETTGAHQTDDTEKPCVRTFAPKGR